MHVIVGNGSIQVTEYDENRNQVRVDYPGFRLTHVFLPDGIKGADALNNAVAAINQHLRPGTSPVWVDSDDEALTQELADHYRISDNEVKKESHDN